MANKQQQKMATKQITMCSMSLFITEMVIKTALSYHFTHPRTGIIMKTKQLSVRMWKNECTPALLCWWECE